MSKLPGILWLTVALIGVFIQITALLAVREDRRFVRDMGYADSRMAVMADGHVRNAMIRLSVVSANVVIGILAIINPSTNNNPPPTGVALLFTIFISLVLIASEVALISMTFFEQRDRHLVARLYQEKLDKEAETHDDTHYRPSREADSEGRSTHPEIGRLPSDEAPDDP